MKKEKDNKKFVREKGKKNLEILESHRNIKIYKIWILLLDARNQLLKPQKNSIGSCTSTSDHVHSLC